MGSGLAYAGGNTFVALPDRGPNAAAYDSEVDDTASYITRFHTLHMTLAPSDPGSPLPFTLTPMLVGTTLLSSKQPLVYGSGIGLGVRQRGAGAERSSITPITSPAAPTTSIRPSSRPIRTTAGSIRKAIRVSSDGQSVYISDEYGPYVYEFKRSTGERVRAFTLPDNLAVSLLSPMGATEISGNTSGRVANKGMEGLADHAERRRWSASCRAPLIQDGGKIIRIVTIDIATGTTHQYAYALTTGTGVSEILAINDHEFLLDERDGKGLGDGSAAVVKQIFKIDLANAVDVSGLSGAANLAPFAVAKTLFLDVVKVLQDERPRPHRHPGQARRTHLRAGRDR